MITTQTVCCTTSSSSLVNALCTHLGETRALGASCSLPQRHTRTHTHTPVVFFPFVVAPQWTMSVPQSMHPQVKVQNAPVLPDTHATSCEACQVREFVFASLHTYCMPLQHMPDTKACIACCGRLVQCAHLRVSIVQIMLQLAPACLTLTG